VADLERRRWAAAPFGLGQLERAVGGGDD